MSHISISLDLMAIPGAKYLNVPGTDGPQVVIPADAKLMKFGNRNGKIQVSVPVRCWTISHERRAQIKSNPSHEVTINPSEEYQKGMVDLMMVALNGMNDEKYTEWTMRTFQNAQGTAKLPASKEEAARWYVTRCLRAGLAWEDEPQAPAAPVIASAPAGEVATPASFGDIPVSANDDLPF